MLDKNKSKQHPEKIPDAEHSCEQPKSASQQRAKKLHRISTVPVSLNVLLKDQLQYLNSHFEVTAVSSPGTDLHEVADREKVRTVAIPIKRRISPWNDLVSLWQLYRLFKKEKPDIIHSITPKAGLLSMIAGKWAGVPVRMHTFTGLIFPYRTGWTQKILIATDRILCAHATHLYPEGQGVKKDLEKFRITGKPLKIIANGNVNGLDIQYFSEGVVSESEKNKLRKKLDISESDFIFIFVGRMVKDKGLNELVEAFRKLHAANRNTRLLLVGSFEHSLDPLNSETLEEIEQNPAITATGFQKDIRPYLAISSALVFPSYREGFPNVVLQALAKGLPAIVTDISGCNEIVDHGCNGLVVQPKNVGELHAAMQELVACSKLYGELRSRVRSSILKYDRNKVWKALVEEYRSVVE